MKKMILLVILFAGMFSLQSTTWGLNDNLLTCTAVKEQVFKKDATDWSGKVGTKCDKWSHMDGYMERSVFKNLPTNQQQAVCTAIGLSHGDCSISNCCGWCHNLGCCAQTWADKPDGKVEKKCIGRL